MMNRSPTLSPPAPSTAHPFRTPQSELRGRLHEARHRSGAPSLLAELLRERFERNPFDASWFHHPERDVAAWKAQTSALLADALILPDAPGRPSQATLRRREVFDDYVVEEVEITVTPPLRAPATVVIPRNGERRHPAIVALHSMGGHRLFGREKLLAFTGEPASLSQYRETYYEGRSLQAELARAGFLSIAIDAIHFGLRTEAALRDPAAFQEWRLRSTPAEAAEQAAAVGRLESPIDHRLLECVGLSTAALVATDDLRTVDYLLERPDVDPSRIGATGLSFGSFRSHYLAALDPRIRATVSVCWHSTLRGIIGYNEPGAMGFFALPPGLYRRLDLVDITALAAPRPFLAISGWDDRLMQPFGIAEAHLFLREAWEKAGAPENLGSLVYPAPHVYNAAMQEAALRFLREKLGGNS
ncbi:MAG TPA: hypothetical protein VNQ90_12000 [Chthoniobacteraceae bacterium]|nr:hypothetical protein [Chthoniobacteraceae bacterium]